MNKGVELRLIIHKILNDIIKQSKNYDISFIKYKVSNNFERDRSFIKNVCLNSMRYQFHTKKIIKKYIKKRTKTNEMLLLISSITQIVFLNFKEYAVIDSTVEIAKRLKIYPGFINAILRKISEDKEELSKIKINFSDLPMWFIYYTKNLNENEKKIFLENFIEEPDLHMVFKNKNLCLQFKEKLITTSEISGFLKDKKRIEDIDYYDDGIWWIQDFSSFYPISKITHDIEKKKCIDLCAAPGGKSFQILAKNNKITLNDINKSRIKRLKKNLDRLNFKTKIYNFDALKINSKEKYDFIVIDAPCSSVGTIRKNPEIFFRLKDPNLKSLISVQKNILKKASTLLNHKGVILYMVCSFLEIETTSLIEDFLGKNTNFQLDRSYFKENNNEYDKLLKNNYMLTLPTKIKNFNIDGFFAVYLRKIDR
tara:strand:+ start:152 stop:1423 length:1272 start_codon:yes stop_codon:yes gene_type:complete